MPNRFPLRPDELDGRRVLLILVEDAEPSGGMVLPSPFFGLAGGPGGQVFVFQWSDQDAGEDDEGPSPWESESDSDFE